MVFYRVSKSKKTPPGEVWLGFCIRGIVAFDVHKDIRTAIFRSPWDKTENISFAVSRIYTSASARLGNLVVPVYDPPAHCTCLLHIERGLY